MSGAGLSIDPFGYWPNLKSAIAGLGGTRSSDRPGYIFHTPYVATATGRVTFTVEFDSLIGSAGSLEFRLMAFHEARSSPRRVRKWTVTIADLVANKGRWSRSLNATHRETYAISATLIDAGDIVAKTVAVTLDKVGSNARYVEHLATAQARSFKRPDMLARLSNPVRYAPGKRNLISFDQANLRDPVSQMCTWAQFHEPDYDRWINLAGLTKQYHRKQWEFAYVLRVLEHRGLLRHGSHGLGFGVGAEFLPALFASLGCSVTATDLPADVQASSGWIDSGQHSESLAQLRRPALCPDDVFGERVTFRPVDMTDIPKDLAGFDFCWSACAYEHLGSIEAGLRFFKDSIRTLRPGGVAVHTSELNLSSNRGTIDHASTVLFRRRDMERLALELVRAGHSVAPLNFDYGSEPPDFHIDMPPYSHDTQLKVALQKYVTTSFGMVVQRGA